MRGSERSLAAEHDVALLDLDGVIYLGHDPIPGVPDALAQARQQGMQLAFVTNNASRTPAQVAELLTGMAIAAEPDEVVNSAQAAAHVLADRLPAGAPVLVLGTTGLIEAVTERGLTPVFSADDAPQAVVQGYSPDLGWKQLAEGMVAIRAGAYYLATNLDLTVPSARGPLPGNGALVAALATASGVRPDATGKPDPTMHAESVQRSGAQRPIVVGDRLDTDIEGAGRVGCPSLLVLTGVTDPVGLLSATPGRRPDYLGHDVSALLRPHPSVTAVEGTVRCGQATVGGSDVLTLSISAGVAGVAGVAGAAGAVTADVDLDGLRALATAVWTAHDDGRSITGLAGADQAARDYLDRLGLTVWKSTD